MVPNIGPNEGEPGYEPLSAAERAEAARRAAEEDAWRAIVADLEPSMPTVVTVPASDPVIDALLAEPEDFVPPDPAPLHAPRHAVARFGWAALLVGPLLVLLTYVFNLDRLLSTIGIVATIAGYVMLLTRLPHSRDEDDDGAIV